MPQQDESKPLQVISPGDEVVASFELATAQWLLFRPVTFNLHAQIDYSIEGANRSQVIPMSVSIKAPIASVLIGTTAGAAFGYLARQIKEDAFVVDSFDWFRFGMSLFATLTMATIIAIGFARKEAAPGFITIEDFFGGFLVGAILGYTGPSYFDKLINTRQGTS